MKYIKLTQGKRAMVDDEDYEELSKHKWNAQKIGSTFYAIGTTRTYTHKHTTLYMHRFIMQTPKGMETDHIDHIRYVYGNNESN